MTSANDFLEQDQLDDFYSCFAGSGFSPDEFEVKQQRENQTGGMLYDPQAGTVTVRCKTTGIERIYKLASGNSWPLDFSNDLQGGLFGKKA